MTERASKLVRILESDYTECRRRKNGDTWHWYKSCSRWPTSDYLRKFTPKGSRPKLSGIEEFCNECKAKDEGGA